MDVRVLRQAAVFAVLGLFSFSVQAQNLSSQRYYTIDENVSQVSQHQGDLMATATQMLEDGIETMSSRGLNLLLWDQHRSTSNWDQVEPYRRAYHFGHWINDPTDDNCMNTRGRVLERDSRVPVKTVSQNRCRVEKGLWDDPYTNSEFEVAKQIQIDHLVPLKNAYTSGAFRWSQKNRCLYANYMGNAFHLLSVSGHENMKKGDSHPGEYLPENPNFRCDYIKAWLKVKTIWGLTMSEDEADGINQAIQDEHCSKAEFKMSFSELSEQRRTIQETDYVCRD